MEAEAVKPVRRVAPQAPLYFKQGTITQDEADARYAQLAGATFTGPVTLPGGATLAAQDAAAQEGGELVLESANGGDDWHVDVLGDAVRWFTDGVIKMLLWRSGLLETGDIHAGSVAADGAMQQNGVDVAKIIISTSPPSGTPASGVGTLWVQY